MAEESKKVIVVGNYALDDDVIGLTGAEIRTGDFIKFIDDDGLYELVLIYGTTEEDDMYKVTRDYSTYQDSIHQRAMHLKDGKEGFVVSSMLWGDEDDR